MLCYWHNRVRKFLLPASHLGALLEPLLLLGDQHHPGERLGHLRTQRVLTVGVRPVRVARAAAARHVPLPTAVRKLSIVTTASTLLPLPDPARLFHDPAVAPAAQARLVQRFGGIPVDAAATVQWQFTKNEKKFRLLLGIRYNQYSGFHPVSRRVS